MMVLLEPRAVYDEFLLGTAECGSTVYDKDKILEYLIQEYMTTEDVDEETSHTMAIEWFDYNISTTPRVLFVSHDDMLIQLENLE